MIRVLLISLNLFFTDQSFALKFEPVKVPTVFESSKCIGKLRDELGRRASRGIWIEKAPARKNARTFASPTSAFGIWHQLTLEKSGAIEVLEISATKNTSAVLASDCERTEKKQKGLDFRSGSSDKLSKWVTDVELEKHLDKSPVGIIYVWSPGMSNSGKYLNNFRAFAKKNEIDFLAVADPRADRNSILAAGKTYGFKEVKKRLDSVEIFMRGTTDHYPMTLVYARGQIHLLPITGVMDEAELNRAVVDRIAELGKVETR